MAAPPRPDRSMGGDRLHAQPKDRHRHNHGRRLGRPEGLRCSRRTGPGGLGLGVAEAQSRVRRGRRPAASVPRRRPSGRRPAAGPFPAGCEAVRTLGRFFFGAGLDLPATDVFWRPGFNPSVLAVEARPVAPGHGDAFDIRSFDAMATVLRRGGSEHVLFSDGLRHLQLTVTAGSVLDGPVCLRTLLSGLRHMEAKVLALRRLCGLCRLGRLPRGLFPPERRAGRWATMLRAWDGERAGASRRRRSSGGRRRTTSGSPVTARACSGSSARHGRWPAAATSGFWAGQRREREAFDG